MLVNDIWGGEVLKGGPADWNTPIWEHDLDAGLRILRLAIDTHLVTSHHLLPLLVRRPGGLVVEVTDGTTAYNAARYRISVFYDLAKVAVNRLAFSQGHELAPYGGTAVAVTPGWLRSEMMLEAFGVTAADWRDALGTAARAPSAPPDFAHSESPRYVGRAVAALAADPDRARWNQRSVDSGALAGTTGSPTSTAPGPTSGRSSRPPTRPPTPRTAPAVMVSGPEGQMVSEAMPATIITNRARRRPPTGRTGTWTSSPSRVRPAARAGSRPSPWRCGPRR